MEEESLVVCGQIQVCLGHDGGFSCLAGRVWRVMVEMFEHRESLRLSWHFCIMR